MALFRLVGLLKQRIFEPSLTAFIGFPFARVYMYFHGMHYFRHEVYELDGYNQEFWKTSGYSLMCVHNFTHESSFKGAPLDWALANVFEDCKQNKTAHSEIYQRHCHLNLPVNQKLHVSSGTSDEKNIM